jgi:hypothetical protein
MIDPQTFTDAPPVPSLYAVDVALEVPAMRVVVVTGGRECTGEVAHLVRRTLEARRPDLVIVGADFGVALEARAWCRSADCGMRVFNVEWVKHPKISQAVTARNAAMVTTAIVCAAAGCVVEVLAFPGGIGTADMVRQSRAAGLRVTEVTP